MVGSEQARIPEPGRDSDTQTEKPHSIAGRRYCQKMLTGGPEIECKAHLVSGSPDFS